jgi:hypothetical protein
LTACDGPGTRNGAVDGRDYRFFGYAARGAPYGPDDGTISPTAMVGSLPFAPEIALPAIRRIFEQDSRLRRDYRMPSGMNPSLTTSDPFGWISEGYFGLDQGLIVMMIENYRSQLIWNLMRKCPSIRTGLRRAGFTGGWLKHCLFR